MEVNRRIRQRKKNRSECLNCKNSVSQAGLLDKGEHGHKKGNEAVLLQNRLITYLIYCIPTSAIPIKISRTADNGSKNEGVFPSVILSPARLPEYIVRNEKRP